MLESTPARIPLIKLSHKWIRMLFIISNSKLRIRLCSQPRIDLSSQSKFYDVLTRPYNSLSNTLLTISTKQHALKTIYMLFSLGYETFTILSSEIYFSLHSSLTISYSHDNSWAKFRISMISGPELPYKISFSEKALAFLRKITKRVDDFACTWTRYISRIKQCFEISSFK